MVAKLDKERRVTFSHYYQKEEEEEDKTIKNCLIKNGKKAKS